MPISEQVKALNALYVALCAFIAAGEQHLAEHTRTVLANGLFDLYGAEVQGDVLTLLRVGARIGVRDVEQALALATTGGQAA